MNHPNNPQRRWPWARRCVVSGLLFCAASSAGGQQAIQETLQIIDGSGVDCRTDDTVNESLLVRLALACNPRQQAVTARWRAHRYRVEGAGSLDDPRLALSAAPQTFAADNTANGYIVEFSQAIPWPGVLTLRTQTADAEANVWRTRIDQQALALTHSVRQYYAQWQYHHQLLKLNRRHQSLWQENIAITEAKYASGNSSKSVVLQARQEYLLLRRDALTLEADIARDESQLRSLLNLPSQAPLEAGQGLDQELVDIREQVVSALFQRIEQQPQVRELAAQRQQKAHELALAEKDRYPNFTLTARYNSLWADHDRRWQVGIGVNLPFDFGKRSSRENSLRAEQEALHWQQEQARLQLHESLVQAYRLWQQARAVNELYRSDLLPLAEEAFVTVRNEYQSGASDFLSLLTTQHQALDTQRQAEKAVYDQFIQQANLTAAAGFIWSTDWNALNVPAGAGQ